MVTIEGVSIVKKWDDYYNNDKFEDEPCDYHGYDILLNGKKVGSTEIIDCWNEYNDICYVERIDIDEEYRGMGIGTTVLTDNLKDDYYSIVLAPDNEDAKRLYQRLGEECNRIPGCDHEFGYFDQGYGVYVI